MKFSVFLASSVLLAGVAQAEVIHVPDHLLVRHNFQKMSSDQPNLPALATATVNPARAASIAVKPELFGLIGVGMVGLVTRRRKRLF